MKYLSLLITVFFIISCQNKSELNNEFTCNTETLSNLKTYKDFKKNFTIEIPNNWKTNYYFDDVMSSIYAADTTVSLTQTTLIDISLVTSNNNIDTAFINKIKADNQRIGLQEIKANNITFLEQPTHYNLSGGKKGKYNYQILNVFSKTPTGFFHMKTEVYGDSLVEQRFCKAISLINNIKLVD